jgi:hypothetical protein
MTDHAELTLDVEYVVDALESRIGASRDEQWKAADLLRNLNRDLNRTKRERDDCRAELDAIHEFLASEKLEEAYQAQKKVIS